MSCLIKGWRRHCEFCRSTNRKGASTLAIFNEDYWKPILLRWCCKKCRIRLEKAIVIKERKHGLKKAR
jgi:hypothetical protein